MNAILQLLFTCVWMGILFAICLILIIFIIGLFIAFYKIFFAKNDIDQDFFNGKLN